MQNSIFRSTPSGGLFGRRDPSRQTFERLAKESKEDRIARLKKQIPLAVAVNKSKTIFIFSR
jgi:hypothetical protein